MLHVITKLKKDNRRNVVSSMVVSIDYHKMNNNGSGKCFCDYHNKVVILNTHFQISFDILS